LSEQKDIDLHRCWIAPQRIEMLVASNAAERRLMLTQVLENTIDGIRDLEGSADIINSWRTSISNDQTGATIFEKRLRFWALIIVTGSGNIPLPVTIIFSSILKRDYVTQIRSPTYGPAPDRAYQA
jgi:hypothetical protein